MIGYMEHKKTVSPSHLEHCQNQSDNHLYNGQIAKQAVSWSGAVIPETVSYKQLQANQLDDDRIISIIAALSGQCVEDVLFWLAVAILTFANSCSSSFD